MQQLTIAASRSKDIPDQEPETVTTKVVHNGQAGRPTIDIPFTKLQALSKGRITMEEVAAYFGCSARTVRRRMVQYGLAEAGPPVYEDQEIDGTIQRVYRRGESTRLSNISDHELDQLVSRIHAQFPSFGRRMIDGYLLQLDHRIPRSRLLASYARAVGPALQQFSNRRLVRRTYNVAGPNSLWHHDGQHGERPTCSSLDRTSFISGLIAWKLVIHAFIDGYSRFVLGLRVSPNNKAATVLDLFEDIADVYGYPSRVRGDHGTENILVSNRMEQVRGIGRGSYIWGRRVESQTETAHY